MEDHLAWTMCCRGRKSGCPAIRREGNQIWIRDDNGQIVTMKVEELFDVYSAVIESAQHCKTAE
jgi:hypothetical protein